MKLFQNKYYWFYFLYALLFIIDIVLYILHYETKIIGTILSLKTIFIIYYYFKDDKEKTNFLRDLFLIDLIICLIFLIILGVAALIKNL